MALEPVAKQRREGALRLTSFDTRYAGRVVSWVRDAEEAYWLAPRTTPPLTAEKVRGWSGSGREPLMLIDWPDPVPLGYGELNILQRKNRTFWLGHLIIDPARRGQGLGRLLTQLLLQRAFYVYEARRVTLVVFPGNVAGVAAYRSAGMVEDGFEIHSFPAYRTRVELLRFRATPVEFPATE